MRFIRQRFWLYQVRRVNMKMKKMFVMQRPFNNRSKRKLKIINSFMMSHWKLCKFLKTKINFNKDLKKISGQRLNNLNNLMMLKRMKLKVKLKQFKYNKKLPRNCQSNNQNNLKFNSKLWKVQFQRPLLSIKTQAQLSLRPNKKSRRKNKNLRKYNKLLSHQQRKSQRKKNNNKVNLYQ